MFFHENRRNILFVIGVLALLLGGVFLFPQTRPWRGSWVWGWSLALILVWSGYRALNWAISRSNTVFFSIFVGGIFTRLLALAVTAGVVRNHSRLSLVVILLSLVGGFALFSAVEIYQLYLNSREPS
ncbi:MAG TPA: hypothetical protein PK876_07560 [Elusimicrobiota bacterium]|nr:hypothetical protein [Elusimicrobiota bacterium]